VISLLCGAALGYLVMQRDACAVPGLARRARAREQPAGQHGSVVLPELTVQAGADAGHRKPAQGTAPPPRSELLAAPNMRLEPMRAGKSD
jgi:hypothetical protein